MSKPQDKDAPSIDTNDPNNPFYIPAYKVERTVAGWSLETDGSAADHAQAMEMAQVLMGQLPSPGPAAAAALPLMSAVRVSGASIGIAVGEASRKYLLTLDSALLPDKTRSQKRAAVNGFAQWAGLKKPLSECSRTDVAEWVQSLRSAQLATPTLANKASYVKAFFAWAQTAGYYPHGDNPAGGQVKYGVREKRLRRKLGFEPFTTDQLNTIYASDAFAKLRPEVQWGALIGLFTGARVSEVGQLHLDDFVTEDGVACIRVSADGEGQSLKTDASARTVPVHPKLLELGLVDYVDTMRRAGKTRLFPKTKIGSVNGHGNFLSAAFGRYIKALGVRPRVGKLGFHSLRKTVVQAMQSGGVPSEHRAQYVGHELGDEHHAAYSRRYSMLELAAKVHPALVFDAIAPKK